MPLNLDDLTPEERMAKAQEALARLNAEKKEEPSEVKADWDDDLIPDLDGKRPTKTAEFYQEEAEKDTVIEHIDPLEAYVRYIQKMQPDANRRTKEGVMISCPMPGHRDDNPSAWFNTEKKLWFCGGCQIGGDIYDLKAISMGHQLPGYRSTKAFKAVREELATDYGFQIVKGKKQDYIVEPTEEKSHDADIIPMPGVDLGDDNKNDDSLIFIDWESIVPPNTFLRYWMESCAIDDIPDEYHLWAGLQALAFLGGTDIVLHDTVPVKSNLFVVMYGGTGVGKSRAINNLKTLCSDVFAFEEPDDDECTGVKLLPTPGSPEALIDSFVHDVKDPATMKVTKKSQVKGFLNVDEFSGFMSRTMRPGSHMKETFIEMYDVIDRDITISSRMSGKASAHAPFMQFAAGTQPNAIHAYLRKTDAVSGFLNRIIFAAGRPRRRPVSIGANVLDFEQAADELRNLSVTVASMTSGGRYAYRLEGDAYDVWDDFFHTKLAPMKLGNDDQEDDTSLLARLDLAMKKLIVLFTLNEGLPQPTAETVKQALSLYDYIRNCYVLVTQDLRYTEYGAAQEKILDFIPKFEMKRNRPPSMRDLARALARKYDRDHINKALKLLIDLDLIQEIPPEKTKVGGRPTVRYTVAN